MPANFARKRTDAESQAFKAKIISLRREGKSMAEIGQELGVSKQYVSLVLNKVGLGGKPVRDTPFVKIQARRDDNDEIQAAIAQLESQGHYTLADNLRVMLERRAADIETRKAKRRANRKPI